MIFVFFTAACEAEAAKSLRQKSSVLLVFNNIAGTRYDEKLTQIALEKRQKSSPARTSRRTGSKCKRHKLNN